jgi:DNA-binding MarR family transcriptional regulator
MARPDPERLSLWRSLAVARESVGMELERALQEERAVSLAWFEALDALVEAGGRAHATDLAEALGTPPSSLSRRLDRLEEEGYVRRDRRDVDARMVTVVITREGRDVHRRCSTTWRRVVQRRFAAHLTETDVIALQRVFAKVLGE